MITKFDKNSAIALYKHEFADCMDDGDYEGAIDSLLKFTNATTNPEFHLAMGMLYMLLTQDSDESELLNLAFREFMMHLQADPQCKLAYRNLLAVAILRHDPQSTMEISDWLKARGQDVSAIVNELAESGIEVFGDSDEFVDLENLFPIGDFGAIARSKYGKVDSDSDEDENGDTSAAPKPSAIIKFRGNSNGERGFSGGKVGSTIKPNIKDRKKSKDVADELDIEDLDMGGLFDVMMRITKDCADSSETDGGEDTAEIDDMSFTLNEDEDGGDLKSRFALREGQRLCTLGRFEEALVVLDTVARKNDRLYYCAECVRANIMIELDRPNDAQVALDRAYSVIPNGALVGTLQCGLYETEGKYELIPNALKNIDVADFIDSEHVNRAMQLALKYCSADDALELAEEYLDEFNSFDVRKIYAQLLYNSGERETAKKELYSLSRVLYDDFNMLYYYITAKANVEEMPVRIETPQSILGLVVDNMIGLVRSDVFKTDDEIIATDTFRYGLETFLTLEFQNTRSVVKLMFETLKIIARDKRLETAVRNALVSPYVEPIVKAVILGELMCTYNGKTEFLAEVSFCPVSDDKLGTLGEGFGPGYYNAYGLCAMLKPGMIKECFSEVKRLNEITHGNDFDERDITYYLWKSINGKDNSKDKDIDSRLEYALGYASKTQAAAAYKAFCKQIDLLSQHND